MKGWVGLVGWPTADGLVVTHQLQVERSTGKVRRSKTNVLPRNQPEDTCRDCRHWTAQSWLQIQNSLLCFRRSVQCLVGLTVCHRKEHRFVGRIGSGVMVSATLHTVQFTLHSLDQIFTLYKNLFHHKMIGYAKKKKKQKWAYWQSTHISEHARHFHWSICKFTLYFVHAFFCSQLKKYTWQMKMKQLFLSKLGECHLFVKVS